MGGQCLCVTENTNTGTVTLVSQICETFENNFDFRYLYKRWRSFQHTVKHRKGLFCKNTEHLEAIKCFRKKLHPEHPKKILEIINIFAGGLVKS